MKSRISSLDYRQIIHSQVRPKHKLMHNVVQHRISHWMEVHLQSAFGATKVLNQLDQMHED